MVNNMPTLDFAILADYARVDGGIAHAHQRGITTQDVEWALRREVERRVGEPGTVWIHGIASGAKLLKVCVLANNNAYVITTAWQE